MLFDELNFCLQRLYSIPFHVDMPFNDSILEEITTAEASSIVLFLELEVLPFPLSLHRNPNLEAYLSLQEPGALCQLCLLHSNNSYQEEKMIFRFTRSGNTARTVRATEPDLPPPPVVEPSQPQVTLEICPDTQ